MIDLHFCCALSLLFLMFENCNDLIQS
eukprot:UN07608